MPELRANIERVARQGAAVDTLDETTARARVLGCYPMLVDTRDTSLAPHLMKDGFWEAWITAAIIHEIRSRGRCRFADIGANVGWYSIVAHSCGAEVALAVEPSPRCADLLDRTFDENGLSVRALRQAAWSRSHEKLELEQDVTNLGGMSVVADRFERVGVESVALDDLDVGPLDVIKIDVEGSEMEVWHGMSRALRHKGVVVFMEFTPESHADPVAELRSIEAQGFQLEIVATDATLLPATPADALECPKGEWMMLRISRRQSKRAMANGKLRLLWVGDAPTMHTGFARVTHSVLRHLEDRFHVGALGLFHNGDPSGFSYPIYSPSPLNDPYGFKRLPEVIDLFKPDAVLVLNDPYYAAKYQDLFEKKAISVPLLAYMPVDSPNIDPEVVAKLSAMSAAIFYTQFGLKEALGAGFRGIASVIPHGIDRSSFYPRDRNQARRMSGLGMHLDSFIVGNVNRNQPRKRIDLTIAYFAEWVRREKLPENVKLLLHCAIKDTHLNGVEKLGRYFGIASRLLFTSNELAWDRGVAEESLANLYASLDVQVSTTLGEGWGLTTMEGMACGVPQIVPDWAALGEWARSAAELIPCTGIDVYPGLSNGIGGVVDSEAFVNRLHALYETEGYRRSASREGLKLVEQPQFTWERIAAQFGDIIEQVVAGVEPPVMEEDRVALHA